MQIFQSKKVTLSAAAIWERNFPGEIQLEYYLMWQPEKNGPTSPPLFNKTFNFSLACCCSTSCALHLQRCALSGGQGISNIQLERCNRYPHTHTHIGLFSLHEGAEPLSVSSGPAGSLSRYNIRSAVRECSMGPSTRSQANAMELISEKYM